MTMDMGIEHIVQDVKIALGKSCATKPEEGNNVKVGITKVGNSVPNLKGNYLVYVALPEARQIQGVLFEQAKAVSSYEELIKNLESIGLRVVRDKYEFP